MKWVWNQHKDKAVDIATGNVLALWGNQGYMVRFEPLHNEEIPGTQEWDEIISMIDEKGEEV